MTGSLVINPIILMVSCYSPVESGDVEGDCKAVAAKRAGTSCVLTLLLLLLRA